MANTNATVKKATAPVKKVEHTAVKPKAAPAKPTKK
jgi:hypothetical protein